MLRYDEIVMRIEAGETGDDIKLGKTETADFTGIRVDFLENREEPRIEKVTNSIPKRNGKHDSESMPVPKPWVIICVGLVGVASLIQHANFFLASCKMSIENEINTLPVINCVETHADNQISVVKQNMEVDQLIVEASKEQNMEIDPINGKSRIGKETMGSS
ncbi:hypothetical protein RHMOL_Rhmol01G0122200 [Rhododendron molle]|uniref:Uncharacterized protein n=1 Tax=Rhododendron molle TaxID=49168 RepID=A0ACC0Q3A7_RHOML|nr:hypothetical protein RHMOL_Rhmol01G0122200 [Rhododendron molle]